MVFSELAQAGIRKTQEKNQRLILDEGQRDNIDNSLHLSGGELGMVVA